MPKYRKKPVVIEAEQFFRDKHFDGKRATIDGIETAVIAGERRFFVRTIEGDMTVSDGDFIITGVKGERYPCKPDIFAATYEAVDEDS
jgi:hypothetical protein